MPLRSEINYGNIRLRMTLKQMSGVCLYVRKLITVTFGSYDAKTNVGCLPLRSTNAFFFQNQQPATLGFTAGKNNRFPAINKNPDTLF